MIRITPILTWAEDHFYGKSDGLISDKDYPLTWEANASTANYQGMETISDVYVQEKISAPHGWHAAEVFLLLSGD